MARRLTATQAKAAKQKKLVILLAVIFAVVAVVQGPKLWKQLHPKPAGMAAPTPGSVPATSGAAATGAAAAPAASGQLHTFSHLELKDPFKALVTIPVAPASSSTPSGDATKSEAAAGKTQTEATPKAPKPASQPAASGTVSFSAAAPPPNAAIVTTNGKKQLVYVGDGFPTAYPVFRLVALASKAVRVGVLGGSFTNGVPTIKLARGKPVTLANEADGSRYVIKLVRLTTAAPKPVQAKGAAPASTTPAPAATTPTTTTPATTTATTTTTATGS